jgi:hypothetical protein
LAEAWDHLRRFPERRVRLEHADGRQGFAAAAPYARIMVTAATPDLEPAWLTQLAKDGVLVAPLALAPGLAYVVRGRVCAGAFHGRLTRAAFFMPLRAEDEAGEGGPEDWPTHLTLRQVPAPWADWLDRRRQRTSWPGFVACVAFLGHLRGLRVSYQTLADGQPGYGLTDGARVAWMGPGVWHVSGDEGHAFGLRLWRDWLDAGGPWPTEFDLRVTPHGLADGDTGAGHVLEGQLCRQVWVLDGTRDRPASI